MKLFSVPAILLFAATGVYAGQPAVIHELLPWSVQSEFLTKIIPCGKYVFIWEVPDKGVMHKFTGFVVKTVKGEPGIVARKFGVSVEPLTSGTTPYVLPLEPNGKSDSGGYTVYLPQGEYASFNKQCAKHLPNRTM